ncbi:MAG: lamin tail domain-containing protein, partial [Phycisphaerales bacterium JB063]
MPIQSTCPNPAALEPLEPRLLFTAVPIITEFLASNDNTLDDEDGDSSDWIEIYNAGDTALDLDGWHLTDKADRLTEWTFPAVSLDPGEYLVVFASNKDRADADGTELHTNFALGAGGEYLALVEADGT